MSRSSNSPLFLIVLVLSCDAHRRAQWRDLDRFEDVVLELDVQAKRSANPLFSPYGGSAGNHRSRSWNGEDEVRSDQWIPAAAK